MELDLSHGENRVVEFKAWRDITKGDSATNIARSIAALSNTGGGRLYFGVDDQGKALPPSPDFPLERFTAEIVHVLLKKHVGDLECQVRYTEFQGNLYPVVHVPRHDEVPWVAPDKNGQMNVFIRSVLPAVVPPTTRQHWEELLGGLMAVREQRQIRKLEDGIVARTQEIARLVASEVKGSMNATAVRDPRPDWELIRLLAKATRDEFGSQIENILAADSPKTSKPARAQLETMITDNIVDGYGLLDDDDELIPIERPSEKLTAVYGFMRSIAYTSWADFQTLSDPRVSPRAHFWDIDGHGVTGVEGMRLNSRISYTDGLDYWRAYASGVFSACRGFAEDTARKPLRVGNF